VTPLINHLSYYVHPRGYRLQYQEIRDEIERVEILTKGKGWILHEGKDIEVKRGDIIWHQKGDSPIYKSDSENPYECLNIIFEIDDRRKCPYPRVNQWYDLEDLDKFCLRAEKDYREGLFPVNLFNTHVLTMIEYQITKSMVSERRINLPSPLKRAIATIEADFISNLSIKDIAAQAKLSVTHLHELFRKHLNTSPHQYILKLRMTQACQRLTVNTEPIKKIALECGFSSDNSFCRSFRQHKKMTPDQFREKYS
jgi:AraC-like DNA-binding protein